MSIGLVQRKTGNPLTVPMTGPLAARLASWLLDERPATDDDRVFVRYKAPMSRFGVIHRCTRRSAVSCGTPGSDAGAVPGCCGATRRRGCWRRPRRCRRSARCLATPTPIPHASTWPRTAGECSRACCPCRKADRHETHGTRIRRPLAGELEEYIRFKASMGRHGATRVQVLRSFDRHCLEHGAVRLERGVVERWIAHRIDANPGGCRSWFSYIRDFGRWMRLAHDP